MYKIQYLNFEVSCNVYRAALMILWVLIFFFFFEIEMVRLQPSSSQGFLQYVKYKWQKQADSLMFAGSI